MQKIAQRRKEMESDPRQAWTLVLVFLAYLALTPTIGLVSSRSRSAAEPPSASIAIPENEPPTSPLVAPRPPAIDEYASLAPETAREPAWTAEDAGREFVDPRPAPMNSTSDSASDLCTLEIRVSVAGRAVDGAWIELRHEPCAGGAASLSLHQTDETGRLELALEPGSVRAVAWSTDASALPGSATLAAGSGATLELALEPALPVTGRVLDARTGAPVAGAAVAFWTLAEKDLVYTGADGTFRHPRFPSHAPAQQVCARAVGYGQSVRYLRLAEDGRWKLSAATAGEVSLTGTGTPWIELALVPELCVRGRVLDERGAPIAAARVSAEGFFHAMPSVAARDGAEACSDAEGRFALTGLRSDIGHTLLVEAGGRAQRSLELAAGEALDVGDVALEREAVLAGVVIDADGIPVEGIEVALELQENSTRVTEGLLDVAARVDARLRHARTGAEGTFVFEHLEPRELTLVVRRGERILLEQVVLPLSDGSFPSPCLTLPGTSYAFAGSVEPR